MARPSQLQKTPTAPPGFASWADLIRFLVEAGLNQADIAIACNVSEQSISRIARGRTADPYWSLGHALITLATDVRRLISKSEAEGKPQLLILKDEAA